MRFGLHIALHFFVPLLIALWFYRSEWKKAFVIMAGTLVVDLDHLLATPLVDPCRCSIGFHPLHSYPAVALWVALTIARPTRLLGLGLIVHMALDAIDCWMMSGACG